MKIILLQDIKDLGKKHDIKEVKSGYARNFLIAKGLAKPATKQALGEIETKKEIVKKRGDELGMIFKKLAKELQDKEFHFYVETGEKQEVFGSIKKDDIKKELEKYLNNDSLSEELKHLVLKKIKIDVDKSLKTLGIHPVEMELPENKKVNINIVLNQIITEH